MRWRCFFAPSSAVESNAAPRRPTAWFGRSATAIMTEKLMNCIFVVGFVIAASFVGFFVFDRCLDCVTLKLVFWGV